MPSEDRRDGVFGRETRVETYRGFEVWLFNCEDAKPPYRAHAGWTVRFEPREIAPNMDAIFRGSDEALVNARRRIDYHVERAQRILLQGQRESRESRGNRIRVADPSHEDYGDIHQ